MYTEQIKQLRTLARKIARINTVLVHHKRILDTQVSFAVLKLSSEDKKRYEKLKGTKAVWFLANNGYLRDTKHLEMVAKATLMKNDCTAEHVKITKSLVVKSSDGFEVTVISRNKKGAMVSISHSDLKTNVTRHLHWNGRTLSGYAPFGYNKIINYQYELYNTVTIPLTDFNQMKKSA